MISPLTWTEVLTAYNDDTGSPKQQEDNTHAASLYLPNRGLRWRNRSHFDPINDARLKSPRWQLPSADELAAP
jgi:hypothetical protein